MTDALPAVAKAQAAPPTLDMRALPLSLQVMFDDRLNTQIERAAEKLSKAVGFTPQHLLGKTESCFAVVLMSLTWRLNPWMVAKATYQTPNGNVGFEGKLCQAIIEHSGHLEGGVKFEHQGDWSQVAGMYEIRKGSSGKDYAHRTWDRKHTKGLGVIVRAQLKGEPKLREWEFWLDQAFPLNSTLWATDPRTQICYTAVRRFANLAVPGLMMGIPFDREEEVDEDPALRARVISPPATAPQVATSSNKLEAALDHYAQATAGAGEAPSGPSYDPVQAGIDIITAPRDEAKAQAEFLAAAKRADTQPEAPRPLHYGTTELDPNRPDLTKMRNELHAEMATPHDDDGVVQDKEQLIANAAYVRRDTEKVIVTFPGKHDVHRESELVIAEGARQLLEIAKKAVGKRGWEWCEKVFALNPWIAADGPTYESLRETRDQCRTASIPKPTPTDEIPTG